MTTEQTLGMIMAPMYRRQRNAAEAALDGIVKILSTELLADTEKLEDIRKLLLGYYSDDKS